MQHAHPEDLAHLLMQQFIIPALPPPSLKTKTQNYLQPRSTLWSTDLAKKAGLFPSGQEHPSVQPESNTDQPTRSEWQGQDGAGRGRSGGPVQGFVPSPDPYESQAPRYRAPESSQPTSPLPVHSLRHSARSRASGSLHNMIHGTLPFPAYSPPSPHPPVLALPGPETHPRPEGVPASGTRASWVRDAMHLAASLAK